MSTAPEALRRDFVGDIIEPGDDGYDAASRTVLVAGTPAYVLRPTSVADVQAGVAFAREEGSGCRYAAAGTALPASAPTPTASSWTSAHSTRWT